MSFRNELNGYHFFILLGLGILFFFFIFSRFGMSVWDYSKFILALLLFVYFPGRVLLLFSKQKLGRVETVSLSFVLGLVTTTVINKFSRWFQIEFVFFLWVIVCLIVFVFFTIKNPPRKKDFSFRITSVGIGIFLILVLVFSILLVDNYKNAVPQEDGSVIINMHYYDGFYRNAISRELSHTVPPQVPAVADLSLSYHYGMDLFVSLFIRYFDLDVFDLNHRLVLTFFFVLLVLMLFVFIKELISSETGALLGVFLVIFGSGGLAYFVTWFLGIPQWGNIFYTFYFFNITNINSFLPVLSIVLGGFFCLFKYIKTRSFSWLLLAGILLAFSLEFKTFVIGPIVGALFLSGLILLVTLRNFSVLKVWLLTTILALPLLTAAYLHNTEGLPYVFKFRYVDWIIMALSKLNLDYLFLTWKGVIQHGRVSLSNILLLIPCVMIFFVGAFGLSIISLPSLIKEFFSFRKIRPERLFLSTFFGGCLLYFFTIQLSLAGRPRNYVHIYAFFLCFIVLTIFWAEKIVNFLQGKKMVLRVIVFVLATAFCIPNTVRFLHVKVDTPDPRPFTSTFLHAVDWVNQNTSRETVILHPPELRYVCYFADRRVVMDNSSHSYLTFHLTARQIKRRALDIERFFKDPVLNARILKSYNVTHVWAVKPSNLSASVEKQSSRIPLYWELRKKGIRKYKKSHFLELVYGNKDFLIYSVHELPAKGKQIFTLEKEDGKFILRPLGKASEKR